MAKMEKHIKDNLKMISWVISKHFRDGVKRGLYEDMFNAGILGLIEAKKRFDLTKGARFNTYAYFWIREYIRRELDKYVFLLEDSCSFDDRSQEKELSLLITSTKEREEVDFRLLLESILEHTKDKYTSEELKVLKEKYGIGKDKSPKTLKEIAAENDMSISSVFGLLHSCIDSIKKGIDNSI